MNKFIIFLVLVAVVVAGWFALSSSSNDYKVIVVDEVSQLEYELAALEVAVDNGTLTTEQAADARVRITNSLAKINANATGTDNTNLTTAQRAQLLEGLDRLKSALLRYQSTLVAVDVEAAKDTRQGGSNRGKTLTSQFVDTVGSVEDVVDEVVDDYESDSTTDDAIEQIDADTSDTVEELIAEEEAQNQASDEVETEVDVDAESDVMIDTDSDVSGEADTSVVSEGEVTQ